jgi:putative Holliday junction resolvase
MPDSARAVYDSLPAHGCLLGFDFGIARVGIATGELETGLAGPLTTLHTRVGAERFAAIGDLVEKWTPVAFVVGLPHRPDDGGEEGEHVLGPRCRRFANQLHGRYGLPVMFCDERFTSREAERRLLDIGIKNWRMRKQLLDAVAAQLILQYFLDSRRHAI